MNGEALRLLIPRKRGSAEGEGAEDNWEGREG